MKNNLPVRIKVSMSTAFIAGVLLPVLETIRRWNQLLDMHYFISWFDDYLIGGFLFFAAWKAKKSLITGRQYLIAAWGFATGMAFSSFFMQLQNLDAGDPAPIYSESVAWVKGVMFIVCIACLWLSFDNHSSEQ